MNNVKTTIKKIDGEFIVRLHINGNYQKNSDYFTRSKKDAKQTAQLMRNEAKQKGKKMRNEAKQKGKKMTKKKIQIFLDSDYFVPVMYKNGDYRIINPRGEFMIIEGDISGNCMDDYLENLKKIDNEGDQDIVKIFVAFKPAFTRVAWEGDDKNEEIKAIEKRQREIAIEQEKLAYRITKLK